MPIPNLNNSNTWIIISLIFSSVIAPVAVWHYQQGIVDDARNTIDEQTLILEQQKLELDTNNQVIELYEKMRVLIADQQSLADKLIHSSNHNEKVRARDKRDANRKQLNLIEGMIMDLTGKNIDEIRPKSAPMPPTLSVQ